ncbi:MAG TPA: radical SAM protein [Thermotogota bacterium]|nr:radical SAM protein [Thermotogota bacterium]HRW93888.1 radical SAM protein [Thermotogota bacterium]
MVREILARSLVSGSGKPDPWFGIQYTINLYRGCSHGCIYCDSRSLCYGIENFDDILVKKNAIALLERELASKRRKGLVGTGSMNDPYQPVEEKVGLTRRALGVIRDHRFGVHVITKSDRVLRDLDVLADCSQVFAAVSFSITTENDELAAKLEPGAPSPSARFQAMEKVAAAGVYTGVTMMPILPELEDAPQQVLALMQKAVDHGARYIIPAFGLTMRDRQRAYFYAKLDKLFPGLRKVYTSRYKDQYQCYSPKTPQLVELFQSFCKQHALADRMKSMGGEPQTQLNLFGNAKD